MSFRVEGPLEFNRTVPLDHVLPKLRALVSAACDLYNYAIAVYFNRTARATPEWKAASGRIVDTLDLICTLFAALHDAKAQILTVMRHVDDWAAACEIKTWKTFCGRSHAIPTEKIKTFHAEVKNLQFIIDEANKS